MAREVGQARRRRQVAQMREQAQAVGRVSEDLACLLGGESGEGQVLGHLPLVDGHDDAVTRVGEPAGAVHRLDEHGLEIEACVDSHDGGDALVQRLVLPSHGIEPRHDFPSLAGPGRIGPDPDAGVAARRPTR
ncbi:MAG: hypothetical protein OXI81_07300 [Paracoccaceae bacterium]|nr:hypothetical protein [Paracoccaceae bacterium]